MINRGNYRTDIFQTEGAKAAFEACLFEACQRSGWLLHAFVVMRNHFHLALETPCANLVAGMQWMEATFANRFNALRGERGHLFQGRYKALLVEEGTALGLVCHYLHLNPVRAGIVSVSQLKAFRYSSYWYLWRPAKRLTFMEATTALSEAGSLKDHRHGWAAYEAFLDWQAAEGPVGRSAAYVNLSRGWALGTADFKAALVKDHALSATSRAWETGGAKEIRAIQWSNELGRALTALRHAPADTLSSPKSADWKLAIAAWLKTRTQVSNRWLTDNVHLGTPAALSRNLTHYRRHIQSRDPAWKRLTSISAT